MVCTWSVSQDLYMDMPTYIALILIAVFSDSSELAFLMIVVGEYKCTD